MNTQPDTLERFVQIANAALMEVGQGPLMYPSFMYDGGPYIQFDTDDHPEDSPEFQALCKAEALARQALGFATPSDPSGGGS